MLRLVLEQMQICSAARASPSCHRRRRAGDPRSPRAAHRRAGRARALPGAVDRWAELRQGSPLIVDNLWDDSDAARAFRAGAAGAALLLLRAFVAARAAQGPRSDDRRAGHRQRRPGRFSCATPGWPGRSRTRPPSRSRTRGSTTARELAAFEERQRLARELHDSVTQSLYTAAMLGLALPTAWERDPTRARQMLAHLRDVTSRALAELRTLLLELRPSVTLQVELGDCCAGGAGLRSRIELPHVEVEGRASCRQGPGRHSTGWRRPRWATSPATPPARARASRCAAPRSRRRGHRRRRPGFDTAEIARNGPHGLDVMRERAPAVVPSLEDRQRARRGASLTLRWPATGAPNATHASVEVHLHSACACPSPPSSCDGEFRLGHWPLPRGFSSLPSSSSAQGVAPIVGGRTRTDDGAEAPTTRSRRTTRHGSARVAGS